MMMSLMVLIGIIIDDDAEFGPGDHDDDYDTHDDEYGQTEPNKHSQ